MCDRELDHRAVYAAQDADDERLGLAHSLMEQVGTQGRHDRKRGKQRAGQRIGVGFRHRAEYVALDPAQREQRNEADDYDRGGKKMARLTSVAARKIVASFPLRPKGAGVSAAPLRGAPSARCRKMFSTMMTLASTMRPKSMAPTDRRLADSPRITRMPMAKKRAKGMVDDTMMALRKSPRKIH